MTISDGNLRALLAPVYVHDEELLDRQCARYLEAADLFQQAYGAGPVSLYRAPGRVNLIGEHTDYNQGYVMPTAIDRDVVVLGRPRSDNLVRACNVESSKYEPFQFEIGAEIPSGPVGHWSNYVRGAAQKLAEFSSKPVHGMDMVVAGRSPHGTPVGVGLSSSTSLTVVATLALAHANGMAMDDQALAELASEAEWYVGTRGGIMDQFASVFGRGGHALFLDCRPLARGQYRLERIPLPPGYRLLICNTGVKHDNTRSEFNTRVFECRVGVYMIRQRFQQVKHLRDVSPESLGLTLSELEALMAELLPVAVEGQRLIDRGVVDAVARDMPPNFRIELGRQYRVRQRCQHVVTENQRVLDSVAALKSGNMLRFGSLMDAAHASARDGYQVSTPEVEMMVDAARSSAGCVGARITGAGWGGCVVAVVEEGAVDGFTATVAERYMRATGIAPDIMVCNSATGAQVVSDGMSV